MLFPNEATCWKKMTAQYPDFPAHARETFSSNCSQLWPCHSCGAPCRSEENGSANVRTHIAALFSYPEDCS